MAQRHRRRHARRRGVCTGEFRAAASRPSPIVLKFTDRKTLLLSTALASTLLIATVAAPATAQVTCSPGTFPPPGPIVVLNPDDSIDCVNVFDRNNGAEDEAIHLTTDGANEFILLDNRGELMVTNLGLASGIRVTTDGTGSFVDIDNSGDMWVQTKGDFSNAFGIIAATIGTDSRLDIHNSGDMWVKTEGDNSYAFGIGAATYRTDSRLDIHNSGDLWVETKGDNSYALGIIAETRETDSRLDIQNSGDMWVKTEGDKSAAYGIRAVTFDPDSPIDIHNSGDIRVETKGDNSIAAGINAVTVGDNSDIDIWNGGLINVETKGPSLANGILVTGPAHDGSTRITNDGGIIWAGWWNGGALNRGNAINLAGVSLAGVPEFEIDPAPTPALIELKGNNGPGHIFGDIVLSDDDRIEVTEGKTYFAGTVLGDSKSDGNSLEIFNGGNLVLCQEGWTGACDPGGWGDAGPGGGGFDPQVGTNGPSYVFIDTFTVRPDGTLTYQLTSKNSPGDYSQVHADTAKLGGTLEAQFLRGWYANTSVYKNIVMAGTRIGTFGNVADNSMLLKSRAVYNGGNVDLRVDRTRFDKVSGLSKNQTAAASGIEKVYSKLPGPGVNPATVSDAFSLFAANLILIPEGGEDIYKNLMDQLTGAQYAQMLQSVMWSGRLMNQAITDRMDCALNHSNAAPVAYDAPGVAPVGAGCFEPGQVKTWVKLAGTWNNNDGDINAPGYDEDQWGIWFGGDYAWTNNWFVGVAGGYFDSEMDFANWGGVNGGSIEYDGGQFAVYGGYDNSVWYNRSILSFGWYSGSSNRDFAAFEAPPVDPGGSPDADMVAFYNETGWRFQVGSNSLLTPFFGIGVGNGELDGFTENDPNGTGVALRVAGSDGDTVATTLGLRYNGEWGAFRPQVAVAWEHEFEDTFQTVKMSFASAPSGSGFRVVGTDLDEDSLLVEAGGAYAVNDSSDLSVRYVGRWLSDYEAQSVMGRFTYKFGAAPAPAPEPLKLAGE